MRATRLSALCSYAAVLLVLGGVWFPLLHHFWIPNGEINSTTILAARNSPPTAELDELDGLNFFSPGWESDKQLLKIAETLLRGEVDLPGYPTARIGMPFRSDDLEKEPPELQLTLASLAVPDTLLEAYQRTGREEFLTSARDVIVAWASYERRAWLPKGFLWNDHAIAARTLVLAKFWRLYRHHPAYQQNVAELVLEFASRNASFLARPSHFTFATNHGVMQNLALLHLCLAFPTLPDVKKYEDLAIARLREQFEFYVNQEGVVLEHSPEYHETGLHFLALAIRYLALLREPIPAEWLRKYEKASTFYSLLRRPDGSLPLIGDTNEGGNPRGPEITNLDPSGSPGALHYSSNWTPTQSDSLFPVSGYAVWWEGLEAWPDSNALRQTVIAWSYSPGGAHKHADDMSVLLWAQGQAWWTNTGYWPYGLVGRTIAESWPGSNAPRLLDEPIDSVRETRLIGSGVSERINAIQLERNGPRNYRASRQVIYWKPDLWIVLDHASGVDDGKTTHTWTTAANVIMRPGPIEGSYSLESNRVPAKLSAFFFASPGAKVNLVKGSMDPFAGWQVVGHIPEPASALVVEQSAKDSWAVAIWESGVRGDSSGSFTKPPSMTRWYGDTEWEIALPLTSGQVSVSRENQDITIRKGGGRVSSAVLKVVPSSDPSAARAEIDRTFAAAAKEYPRFRDRIEYRWKVSYILLLLFALQEFAFLTCRRYLSKHYSALRIAVTLVWAGAGFWITTVFLR
jgi:hypothetical protein